jgi:hypothetical protein
MNSLCQTPDDAVRADFEKALEDWRALPAALDVCLRVISNAGFAEAAIEWCLLDQHTQTPTDATFEHLPSDPDYPSLRLFYDIIFRLLQVQPGLSRDPRTVPSSIFPRFLASFLVQFCLISLN